MRIAIVAPTVGFGGGLERFAFDRAVALRARGHEVVLVHAGGRGRDADAYAEGFSAVFDRADRRALRGVDVALVQRANGLDELAWLGATRAAVFAHDHDLSCPRSHRYVPMGRTPCHEAPGAPCVLHGCVVVRDRSAGRFALRVVDPFSLRSRTLALARRYPLVACSAYVARSLTALGVQTSRVTVLHPVPPPSFAPAAPADARPTLVVIGSLLRGKGVDIAIDALRSLAPSVRLRVVGEGPERAALEAQSRAVAPGRVEFMGAIHPSLVAAQIDASACVLVPSRWPEPFGMTGIEAMQRARPVVAARHGGIPEWLRESEGVRGFEPGDAASLAAAVRSLLRDPGAGERARAWAAQRWSFEASVSQMESIAAEIAGQTENQEESWTFDPTSCFAP